MNRDKSKKCRDCIHYGGCRYSDLCRRCITRWVVDGYKPAWEAKPDVEVVV